MGRLLHLSALAVLVTTTTSACFLLVPIDDDLSAGGDGPSDAMMSSDPATPLGDGGGAGANEGSSFERAIDAGDGAPSREPCPSPDPSLVAWFRFDETNGATTATDCSQSNMVATAVGTPKWTTGRIGGGVDLNGASTCFEVDPDLLDFEGQPFTVGAWVFPRQFSTPSQTGRHIISRKTPLGWHLGADNEDRLELDLELPDSGKVEVFAEGTPANTWTHFAAVYVPGQRITVYVNGIRGPTRTQNVPMRFGGDVGGALRIGCRNPNANHFDGIIDELRVYNRALDDEEVAGLPTK